LYSIPPITRRQIYEPYLEDLRVGIKIMKSPGVQPRLQQKYRTFGLLKEVWKGIKQQLWRFNNELIYNLD